MLLEYGVGAKGREGTTAAGGGEGGGSGSGGGGTDGGSSNVQRDGAITPLSPPCSVLGQAPRRHGPGGRRGGRGGGREGALVEAGPVLICP